jgi:hypothetical protein
MKYCYQCGHITVGEPLYCNYCGRSYSVKLCPRGHANPRIAEVCSLCGSRDLSTPQPRVPVLVRIAVFFLSLLPGALLVLASVLVLLVFLRELFTHPQWILALAFLGIALAVLAWIWSQTPLWFRKAVKRLLERSRKEDRQ